MKADRRTVYAHSVMLIEEPDSGNLLVTVCLCLVSTAVLLHMWSQRIVFDLQKNELYYNVGFHHNRMKRRLDSISYIDLRLDGTVCVFTFVYKGGYKEEKMYYSQADFFYKMNYKRMKKAIDEYFSKQRTTSVDAQSNDIDT